MSAKWGEIPKAKFHANQLTVGTPIYQELCRYNDRRWLRTTIRWILAIAASVLVGTGFGLLVEALARFSAGS